MASHANNQDEKPTSPPQNSLNVQFEGGWCSVSGETPDFRLTTDEDGDACVQFKIGNANKLETRKPDVEPSLQLITGVFFKTFLNGTWRYTSTKSGYLEMTIDGGDCKVSSRARTLNFSCVCVMCSTGNAQLLLDLKSASGNGSANNARTTDETAFGVMATCSGKLDFTFKKITFQSPVLKDLCFEFIKN